MSVLNARPTIPHAMPENICFGLFSANGAAGTMSANPAPTFLFSNRTAGTGSFQTTGSPRWARDLAADRVARGTHGENFFCRARLFGKFLGVVIAQCKTLIRGSVRSVTLRSFSGSTRQSGDLS